MIKADPRRMISERAQLEPLGSISARNIISAVHGTIVRLLFLVIDSAVGGVDA